MIFSPCVSYRLGSSGSDTNGAYLMSHSANTGSMPNHYRFSPCSLRLMYPVIVHKGTCLQRHRANHCGNEVVEEGEECDCGNSDVCSYNDPCCTPSDAPRKSTDSPCTVPRSRGKTCSPLSGACCSVDCQAVGDSSKVCDEATECHGRSLCDGVSGKCPGAATKPNGTSCDGGSRFCVAGRCTGTVCQRHGLMICRCSNPPEDRCKLCCRASLGSQCLPAEALGIVGKRQRAIYLSPGEPCDDPLLAFCDEKHSCVPHLSVAHATLVEETPVNWFINYWPYLLAFIVAGLIGLVFFNWCVFHLEDAHMRSVHYGKIMAIFRIATVVGLQTLRDIAVSRYVFERFEKKVVRGNLPVSYLEAMSRLRTFFPTCPLSHMVNTVLMVTSEDVVVRVLLAQGFAFRRFVPKLADSEYAHLAHLLPARGLADRYSVQRPLEGTVSLGESESLILDFLAGRESDLGSVGSSGVLGLESGSAWGSELSSAFPLSDSASDSSFGSVSSAAGSLSGSSEFYASYLRKFKEELARSRDVVKGSTSNQLRESVVYGRTKSGTAHDDVLEKQMPRTKRPSPILKRRQLKPASPMSWPALPTSSPVSRTFITESVSGSTTLSKSFSNTTRLKVKKETACEAEQMRELKAAKRRAENLLKSVAKQTEQELISKLERTSMREETLKPDENNREEEKVQRLVLEPQEEVRKESEKDQTTSLWWLFLAPWFGSSSSKEVRADTAQFHGSSGANEGMDKHQATTPAKDSQPGEVARTQAASGPAYAVQSSSGVSASAVNAKEGRTGDVGRAPLKMQPSTSKQPNALLNASTATEARSSRGSGTSQQPSVSRMAGTSQKTSVPQPAGVSQEPSVSRLSPTFGQTKQLSILAESENHGASEQQTYLHFGQASGYPSHLSSTQTDADVDNTGCQSSKSTRAKGKSPTSRVSFSLASAVSTNSPYYLDCESTGLDDEPHYGMDFVDVHMDRTQQQQQPHRMPGSRETCGKRLWRAAALGLGTLKSARGGRSKPERIPRS